MLVPVLFMKGCTRVAVLMARRASILSRIIATDHKY